LQVGDVVTIIIFICFFNQIWNFRIGRQGAPFYDGVVKASGAEKLRKINLQRAMFFGMMRLAQKIGILPLHAPQIQPTEYNKT
jgi:hypothetical protein